MSEGNTPRVVVFGYGNTSRGDDAIGPLLLAHLAQLQLPGVVCIEDFQLQIEHALDMVGASLVLFIDAGTGTPAPYSFSEVQAGGQFTAFTHALLPHSVLAVYRQVQGSEPPPAFVLCVRGERFGLGEAMSEQGTARMAQAQRLLAQLCGQPHVPAWRAATVTPRQAA
jgi:hydrogenase maturation protease